MEKAQDNFVPGLCVQRKEEEPVLDASQLWV
jgi:hypothetical protein